MSVWVGWDWLKAQWGVGWDSNTQGLSTVIGEKTMCGHACRWEGRCAGEPVFMQVLFWLFLFFHWSMKEGHKLRVRIGKEMLKVWEKERYEMLLWRYGEVNGQGSTISLQGSTKNPLEWSGIYSESHHFTCMFFSSHSQLACRPTKGTELYMIMMVGICQERTVKQEKIKDIKGVCKKKITIIVQGI